MVKKKKESLEEKRKRELLARQDTQLKWILFVLVVIILIAVGVYFMVNSTKRFSYGGLQFEKIMFDKLPLYYSMIQLTSYDGNRINHHLYLRNDPRKLTDVLINGNIVINPTVVFAVDPESDTLCQDNPLAGGLINQFFQANGVKYSATYTNKSYALERNMTYVDCSKVSGQQTFLALKMGNETEINQDSQNCYTLSFKNCEVLKVTERFIVGAYANSKGIKI